MRDYSRDPEWREVHAEYLRQGDDTPSERMLRRIAAAQRLRDIETCINASP